MKKIELYLLECLLFIFIIIFSILLKNRFYLSISIVLIGLVFIKKFGIMKDNNYIKPYVTKNTIACIMIYFVIIYILGLLLGFNKTIFSCNISYIFGYIVLNSIVIIVEEIMRYIICKNSNKEKLPIIFYTFILIVLNIIIQINNIYLSSNEGLFIFITTIIIPTISREVLSSYLTYKVSFIPSLVFNTTIKMYDYVLPIIPRLGNYLYSVCNILLPYTIYLATNKMIYYNKKENIFENRIIRKIITIPIIIILFFLITLTSGVFSHTIIAIASNSMEPTYKRGDSIIYKKEKISNIEIGQVLAFKIDNTIITHRIIDKKNINNKIVFYTKGDANKAPDSFQVKEEDVLGVVKYIIKYFGYPTLWFNDVLNRKE